ncbi:hypothetical protein M408DRAFT_328827 [Serendipita vermifera MAFF 305830]|uniref:Uncharacterized protein n=1 Tax=Serendipita vermifera MAFF 305830 TaxID=933852 RepID=A0A0C2WTZ8_SERVB|nr:hypothetical protein M408DRAFT_328827 [Serendipita vermifera MAFF 305830]
MESLDSNQTISNNRRFSASSIIPPLLLITGVSVALGLAPYVRLRHHILRQSGAIQSIRSGIEDGNSRFLEYVKARDVEAAARQIEHQRTQVELKLKVEELDRRCLELERLSRQLSIMQAQLDKSNAQTRSIERLLDEIGQQTGSSFGQIAAFMEETQLKEGEPDRFGVLRLRQLALLLQNRPTSRTDTANNSSPEPPLR